MQVLAVVSVVAASQLVALVAAEGLLRLTVRAIARSRGHSS